MTTFAFKVTILGSKFISSPEYLYEKVDSEAQRHQGKSFQYYK